MDNVFTKSLQYLCPSKIDHVESEAYIAEIAKVLLPHEYIDEICREWKKLQASKDYFESGFYSQYLRECQDRSIKLSERTRIDHVWRRVIEDKQTFPSLSELLKACLSFFHATASVEGSVNMIRNVLGD